MRVARASSLSILQGCFPARIESARTAAGQVDVDVRVIDSACCTAQAALQVKQLCALRDAGATLDEAQAAIEALAPKTQFLVACDTLEIMLKAVAFRLIRLRMPAC